MRHVLLTSARTTLFVLAGIALGLGSVAGCGSKNGKVKAKPATPTETSTPTQTTTPTATTTATQPSSVFAATELIPRRQIFGNPDRAGVQISPDGKYVSFLAPRDGVMNVYVAP